MATYVNPRIREGGPRPRGPWLLAVAAVAAGVVVLEVAARVLIGAPPVFATDTLIGYFRMPNQEGTYAGKGYAYNGYGMRSDSITPRKPPRVYRILVIGDDVLEGSGVVDQSELATTLLQERLEPPGRSVEVLNVSAKGWGPGNQSAYLMKFGVFDADAAVVVLSASDLVDDRVVGSIDTLTYPIVSPAWVSMFHLRRALWTGNDEIRSRASGDARSSLPELISVLRQVPNRTCVVLHSSALEVAQGGSSAALDALQSVLSDLEVDIVRDAEFFDAGRDYETNEIPNASGHDRLAEAIRRCPAIP